MIQVCLDAIPDYVRDRLAEAALEITRAVFAEPGEEERFQRWLAERRKEGER